MVLLLYTPKSYIFQGVVCGTAFASVKLLCGLSCVFESCCMLKLKSIKENLDWLLGGSTDGRFGIEERRRSVSAVIEPLDAKKVIRSTNGKIQKMKLRFKKYKEKAALSGGQLDVDVSIAVKEYKRTIKLTLIEVQGLMKSFAELDFEGRPWLAKNIKEELESCFVILDSCLSGLESQNSRIKEIEENYLILEYSTYRSDGVKKVYRKVVLGQKTPALVARSFLIS